MHELKYRYAWYGHGWGELVWVPITYIQPLFYRCYFISFIFPEPLWLILTDFYSFLSAVFIETEGLFKVTGKSGNVLKIMQDRAVK